MNPPDLSTGAAGSAGSRLDPIRTNSPAAHPMDAETPGAVVPGVGRTRTLRRLLRIAAAALAALIAWEVILENCVLREPGGISSPILGRILKPGVYLQGTEGFCRTRMNGLGLRGMEIPPKRPSEYRILVLGDSFTEALQVSDGETFVELLQSSLTQKRGRDVRVLNGGRNGASPAYYIHLAYFFNSSVQPDHVIVQVDDGDFTKKIMDSRTREFYVKVDGAAYTTVTNFQDYYIWQMFPQLKLIKPFVSLSTFKIALDRLKTIVDDRKKGKIAVNDDPMPAVPCEKLVDWTLKTLKDKYPKMAILFLTFEKSESEEEVLLKASASKYGIDVINIREAFARYYQTHIQPVNGFDNTIPGTGHMNAVGHTIVADCLADYYDGKVSQ